MKVRRVKVLVLNVILLIMLVVSVDGGVWNSYYIQGLPVSCETPKVVLQSGTAGASTIYTSNTSARVNVIAPAPVPTYYPTEFDVLSGNWRNFSYNYRRQITITNNATDWLSGWDKRVKITIDHNDVESVLSDFPVLVYLSNSSGRNNDDVSFVFDELQSDANRRKIAVTTSDETTECYVEIEKWDDAGEEAWLWVKVPSISSSADTDLYLYYDVDHADNTAHVGDPDSTPAENVWDSNFIFVSHMRDDPDTSQIGDSTSNNYDGTKTSANNPPVTSGRIGDAQAFDGVDDIVTDTITHNVGTGDFTWSAWVKTGSSFNNINPIFTNGEYSPAWYTKCWNDNRWGYYFGGYIFADSTLSTGTEYFLAVARDSGTIRFYKDGATDGTGTDSSNMANSLLAIGRSGVSYHGIHDYIDEARFSTNARGAAWIKASYESGKDHLVDFESETLSSGYSVSVTIDTASLVSAGKMRLDGNDLRIVYWNSTGFNWLELNRDVIDMNSSSTEVWFKTQAPIGAGSFDSNYYVYYGCSSAVSPPSDKSEVYLYWADFEDATQGWTTSGYNYNWERDSEENLVGFPLPGSWNDLGWEPTEAHGGTYLWGTDIGAPYPDDNNQYGYLNSPAIDLTSAQGDVTLRYWLAYNVEGAGYDSFRVEIDDNSGFTSPTAIEIVGETGGYIYDIQQNWYEDTYNVTSYKGGYLYMRVGFESDGGWRFGGVYVDDVNIRQSVSPEPSTSVGPEELSGYVSGTVPESVQAVDSDYLIIKSAGSATATPSYHPFDYTLGVSTTLESGSVSNLTSNDSVYMTFRSQEDGGLNWFLNSDSKVYTPTVRSWQDVDVSGDTDIPTGATGLVIEVINENATTDFIGQVRAKGSTDDRTAGAKIKAGTQIMAFVKLDSNKKFQAYRDNAAIKFYIRAYTDSDVTLFTDWSDVAGGHTAYNWYTVDLSGKGVPSSSIAILELYDHSSSSYAGLSFRRNGDSDYATYGSAFQHGHQFIMVGVDADSKFQHYKRNNDYSNFYLVGYLENRGTWKATPSGDVLGTTTGAWTDIDVTSETSSNAKLVMLRITCGWTSSQPKKGDIRKKGSSDDQFAYANHWYQNPQSSIFHIVGLDENQIFETKIESTAVNGYVVGYLEPTLEIEFIGSSNTYEWTQLEWTVDSAWTNGSVRVTLQLYNYSLGDYPTSGNGHISYTSSATANTDETKNQIITVNPTDFRNATGYWKIKVTGVKATVTQFDFKADWIEFKPTHYSEYTVSTEFAFSNMTKNAPTQLNFTVVSEYDIASVSVTIQVWNYSSSAYVTSGEGYLTYTSTGANVTKVLSINTNLQFYTSSGYAKIKVTGVKSTSTQFQQKTNQIKLDYSYSASSTYDYVLKVVNQVADAWQVNLQVYDNSTIDRLSSATISLYNETTTSDQIIVSGGVITQPEGPLYDLGDSKTIKIKITNLQATASETSYLYVYLKVLKVPETSTYNLFIITFEIT